MSDGVRKRRGPPVEAKLIRISGACQNVRVHDLMSGDIQLEGLEGIVRDEHALLLLPTGQAHEVVFRWVVGDHAGAIVLR